MATPKVKFCGISEPLHVVQSVQLGVSYLGFVHFPKSPRHLEIDSIAELVSQVPEMVKSVVVLVNPDNALITKVDIEVSPDVIQLHDKSSVERVAAIRALTKCQIIKAFPVSSASDLENIDDYADIVDFYLFDAKAAPQDTLPGGNGRVFDWSILRNKRFKKPWFLSGGLAVQNIEDALRLTDATFVDTSSGIEREAGVKDSQKMQQFMAAVNAISD